MEKDYESDEPSDEERLDQGEIESSEEAFLRGYSEDDGEQECAECGKAITKEDKKALSKEFEGEKYFFCGKDCAKEFEESLASKE